MEVEQLRPGLWRWTAVHPDWKQGDEWEQEVCSVYYEAPAATVLFDPLVPLERERFFEALDRDVEGRGLPVAILLTVPWHERSATELRERYAATDAVPDGVENSPCERSTRPSGGCPSTAPSSPATCCWARRGAD